VTEAVGLRDSKLYNALGARRQPLRRDIPLASPADVFFYQIEYKTAFQPRLAQHLRGYAAALARESQQDMLAPDIAVAELGRRAVREVEDAFRRSVNLSSKRIIIFRFSGGLFKYPCHCPPVQCQVLCRFALYTERPVFTPAPVCCPIYVIARFAALYESIAV
jgi:hypothetical protein